MGRCPRRRSTPHPEDVRRPGSLAIGGEPRVDLMPPEVRIKRAQLRTRRSLRLGLVAVVAVVVLGCGGSMAWSALAGVTLATAVLAFDLGAFALVVGAWTGSRGLALGVGAGGSAAAYLVSSLSPVVEPIRHVRWASPFFWAVGDDQLSSGVGAGQLALLACLGLVLVVAAVAGFRRLDIR